MPTYLSKSDPPCPEGQSSLASLLRILRSRGGRVSVHNDYEEDGSLYTSWQMTFPIGPPDPLGEPRLIAFIGEGEDDEAALENIVHEYDTYIAQEVMAGRINPVPPQTIEQARHQAAERFLNHLTKAVECHSPEEATDALRQTEPRIEPGGIKDPGPGRA